MDSSDMLKKRLEWMECDDRTNSLYINGVNEFLYFAFGDLANSSDIGEDEIKVPCPCNRCNNSTHKTKDEIFNDLLLNGIVRGYVRWVYHGEFKPPQKRKRADLGDGNSDDIRRMIYDRSGPAFFNDRVDEEFGDEQADGFDDEQVNLEPKVHEYAKGSKEAKMLDSLMKDAEQTPYPGCENYSKLSCILKLFQIKCMDGMTNKAFNNNLKMYKDVLPKGADVPSNYYEARKMITDLGFDYEKIEACKNDCMIFWKENAKLVKCTICDRKSDRKSPKVLRYFPLKPRLQRLFMSSKTASDMRWHAESREEEPEVLTHPADGKAWKHFDEKHQSFAL
ncbi:uncharacterized protein [Spinacia oleracea]|uniref:Transposase-associated domain-containing protein n=1 Tax=Spinacia oleracea TaxID=3562 RepID=A0A9R0K2Z0_SPIOL|nr:uncharacterized protein LOC110794981 [Spinacia oleracea]